MHTSFSAENSESEKESNFDLSLRSIHLVDGKINTNKRETVRDWEDSQCNSVDVAHKFSVLHKYKKGMSQYLFDNSKDNEFFDSRIQAGEAPFENSIMD